MPESTRGNSKPTIAYFTVVQDGRSGWTGGLLVLDHGGRPVEFQCTLPVRPTRSHEILFGPTLRGHVVADIIGKLLIEKCRTPISLVCCECPEALKVASFTDAPVALIAEAAEEDEGPIAEDTLQGFGVVSLSGATLHVPSRDHADVHRLAEQFLDLPDAVEPFERIREAIREAHSQLAHTRSAA